MAKKSWQEDMQTVREPEVKPTPMDFAGIRRGQKMLITTSGLVASFVQRTSPGDTLGVEALREWLGTESGAGVTPVWRLLEPGTPTLEKVCFDPAPVTQLRRSEGRRG